MNYFKLVQYFCIQVSQDFIHLNYVFRVFPANLWMDQCTVNKCSSRVKDVSALSRSIGSNIIEDIQNEKEIFIHNFVFTDRFVNTISRRNLIHIISVLVTFKSYEVVVSLLLSLLETERPVWVSMSMCFNSKPPKQKYNYKVRDWLARKLLSNM